MPAIADQGTGVYLELVTSATDLLIVDLRRTGISRGSVDTTHSETTPDASGYLWRTFRPSDIIDGGMIEAEVHFDARIALPINADIQSCKIHFPAGDGETTGPILTFNAFMTAQDDSYSPLDDVTMKATLRFKVSGAYTLTAAVAAI